MERCGRLQGDRVAEAPPGGKDPFEVGRCGGTRHRHPVVREHLQGAGFPKTFPRGQDFAPTPYGLPRHRIRGRKGQQRAGIAPLEEAQKGAQAGRDILKHRDTEGAQACCGAILDRASYAADHRERFVGRLPDPFGGPGVTPFRPVAVQVHHVGESPRILVIGQMPGAVQKDVVWVVVRTPGVQWVGGRQTRLQPCGDALQGLFGRPGQGNVEVGCGVDQVRPLSS